MTEKKPKEEIKKEILKLTEIEVSKELKRIAKIDEPIKVTNELKELKNNSDLDLQTLKKQLNFIRKSLKKDSVTSVTSVEGVTSVTSVTSPPVTPVTCNTLLLERVFGDSNLEQIMKHLVITKSALTFGELAIKTGKSEANIRNTISRNKVYFGTIGSKGKMCYNYLLQVANDEIQLRIDKINDFLESEQKREEDRKRDLKIDEEYEIDIKSFVNLHKPKREGKSIYLDFNELISYDPKLADSFTDKPEKFLEIFSKCFEGNLDVRILNLPNSSTLNIEEIRKEHLEKIICVEGRITSFGEVKPIIEKINFECPSCGSILTKEQNYRIGDLEEPKRCSCGRKGGFHIMSREEVNSCFIQLEDLQERTDNPHSQRIKAVLFNDLTEKENIKIFNPGNEIKCVGLLREVPIFKNRKKTIFLNWILEIISAELIEKEIEIINLSEEDKQQFIELSSEIDEGGLSPLLDSFAPDVYGYEEIKKAIILQLCNKRNNKKEKGMRNKSNILLIGDPGVAKSVLCDFALEITPGSRKAVGGGSSAVGITASVVKEEDALGGYRVEPGALILAKDLLVLDELNNLHDEDKPKLQEGMNEQTVSINKANIHVQMKVTCGMIAIANPKGGHFIEDGRNISEQFNIPSPILNRFDSIFVFRDKQDEQIDMKIAERMIHRHRGTLAPKYDKEFLKKFFVYIKNIPEPKITDESEKRLQKTYAEIRKIKNNGVRINPRFLESLTRMSISAAKLRQADVVEDKDISVALNILSKSQYEIKWENRIPIMDKN